MVDMNEEETIKLFLKNGFQISKNALSLASKNPQTIISKLKKIKPRPFIITEHHMKKVLEDTSVQTIDVKLIKEYVFSPEPIHIDDYVKELSSRYEKIKSLLLKQMTPKKLVSINKINPRTVALSVIGLVRKKNDNSILIEDSTGEINLYFDEDMREELENILLDDVIGAQCKKIKEKYYIKKVFFPDILSSRKINKTKDEIQIAIAFSPSGSTPSYHKKLIDRISSIKNFSTLFLFSHVTAVPTSNVSSKFKLIQISPDTAPKLFQLDEIKILAIPKLFFENFFKSTVTQEVFISILKRRELFIPFSPIINAHKNFILDEPPDIIISDFDGSFYQNYKGTTIISNSNPQKVFFVNLKTREVHETLV